MTKTYVTNTNKRFLRVIIAAVAVLLLCGVFCGAGAADEAITEDTTELTPGVSYYLQGDVTLKNNLTLTGESEESTALDLQGHVLTGNGSGPVITLKGGRTLELKDSNPDKLSHYFTYVDNGLWTPYPGTPMEYVELDKFDRATAQSGITVVCIPGGVITGGNNSNAGGGLRLEASSTVQMFGGNIVGNKSPYGGGIGQRENSTFTMSGGSIAGNTATNCGGGVNMDGNSLFTMSGDAKIIGNVVTGTDKNAQGGGVRFNADTTGEISGNAIIAGNKATYGGGVVLLQNSSVTMSGGSIAGNTSTSHGAGVRLNDACSFTMSNNAKITNNNARYGGGVHVSNGSFTMSGGSITNNTAKEYGGGMCLDGGSTTISGNAKITNNSVRTTNYGGGVNVNAAFIVSGSPDISGNTMGEEDAETTNNVRLVSGKIITIGEDGLTENAEIGVTTATAPGATPVTITEANDTDYHSYFTSDDRRYGITVNSKNKLSLTRWAVNGPELLPHGRLSFSSAESGSPKIITAAAGVTVYALFTPDSGYGIRDRDISVSGVTSGTAAPEVTQVSKNVFKFRMPADGVNVTGVFERLYTVTFNTNGHGTAPEDQSVFSGEKAARPTNPTEIGYTFSGWFKEPACENKWNFETDTVTKDTTLYALWTSSLTLVSYNGYVRDKSGADIFDPVNPAKKAYDYNTGVEYSSVRTDSTLPFNHEREAGIIYQTAVASSPLQFTAAPVFYSISGAHTTLTMVRVSALNGETVMDTVDGVWNEETKEVTFSGLDVTGAGGLQVEFYGYKLGDADRNGTVQANDASIITMDLVNIRHMPAEVLFYADTDQNGAIQANDASVIAMFLVNRLSKNIYWF